MSETVPFHCKDERCPCLYRAALGARRAAYEWFIALKKKKAPAATGAGKGNQ